VQNPEFLYFLAPNLNYANTNLIYAIIIVYEQFESSSKMSTHVSSSVLFVTDFFSPSTTMELINIKIQDFAPNILRVSGALDPTLYGLHTTTCTWSDRLSSSISYFEEKNVVPTY
jgi:hypothetical protein